MFAALPLGNGYYMIRAVAIWRLGISRLTTELLDESFELDAP